MEARALNFSAPIQRTKVHVFLLTDRDTDIRYGRESAEKVPMLSTLSFCKKLSPDLAGTMYFGLAGKTIRRQIHMQKSSPVLPGPICPALILHDIVLLFCLLQSCFLFRYALLKTVQLTILLLVLLVPEAEGCCRQII